MKPHTVEVDRTKTPYGVTFADTFNVSVTLVDRHLEEGRGGKPVLVSAGASFSYGEIAERINRAANAFKALGIGPGDRIMLFCKDGPAFYDGFLGAARIGAVAIPVNYFLRTADYEYMLADSGACAVIAHSDMFDEVEPALAAAGGAVVHRICVDGAPPGWLSHDALLAAADPVCPPAETSAESDCFWLYSSGSTGSPKASVHQHKDQIYTSLYYAEAIAGITEDDVLFSPPKMFFAYGLGNSVSFPLWTGATCAYLEGRPNAENTLEAIAAFKPTVYFGVPTLYAMQLAALETGCEADLSSIRWSASGGEPLPASVYERWLARTGSEIIESIGSSEALHFYTANAPGKVKPGSCGPIVPGYEGRIVGEDDADLPDGEVGEFVIKGDSVAAYYWNKPERTARSMRDGWFFTGDTCYRDGDGYYFFCGRDDDMLKVGGIWVAPFEVESAIAAHPAVLEAAVVGWPDENGLIKPKAYVALKDPGAACEAMEADLVAFVRERLAPFKYPRWVEFVDDLPKTATGKIQRYRLRTG